MENPVCLITGGASGIGAACARTFTAHGYRVVIGDIQHEQGQGVADELGADCLYRPLDVAREDDFERVVDETVAHWGHLDCMVNNAAVVGVLGPIADIPAEEFDFTSGLVFRSVFLGMKHAARVMRERNSGVIVNISSAAGLVNGMGPHVYTACKAAVIQLTQSVALELAEHDIRVNAVCPGNTATPIHTGVNDERWRTRMEKIRGSMVDDQALHRIAEPEEIAEAVLWLASDAAGFVTGVALPVDGGMSTGRPWRKQPVFLRDYHPAVVRRRDR